MRNPKAARGEEKERYQRIRDVVHGKRARVLITPFSRDVDDINAQLRLLPQSVAASPGAWMPLTWQVEQIKQLSELPPCAALTLPSVVAHYSETDGEGSRYVSFGHGDRRYFPTRLHLHTDILENPLNKLLAKLLSKSLSVVLA